MITKEIYVDLQEKYGKVIKLMKEVDPAATPYQSKYLAKQELITMKAGIEELLRKMNDNDSKEFAKLTGMLGVVFYYLGLVSIDVEELSNAKKFFNKCKECIQELRYKPEVVQVTQLLYNQLGILSSESDPQESLLQIREAEEAFNKCKESGEAPIDISDLFVANVEVYDIEKARKNLEKNYTLTLYYLAQIHGALKDALCSSIYCHVTLQRQLEYDDYDPIDWALNAATLSQFFMEKYGFKQARHHLAASSYILDKYEQQLNEIVEHNDQYEEKIATFKYRGADVARCWAKYGLYLLSTSKERLLKLTDDSTVNCQLSTDMTKLVLDSDSAAHVKDLSNLDFPTLNVTSYENQITDQFVLTVQDARKVFTNIQNWLDKAQEYYTIDNLASDYIEITQDKSQMYANLAFFEENAENQAKLHKRRATLLEDIMKVTNPTYYLDYCKRIRLELAQIYTDILDIKMEKLQESSERPTPHALSKINSLVEKAIQQYRDFIDLFKLPSSNELPKTISEEFEKAFLQAYFHIGALHNRYIVLDKQAKAANDEKSLEVYKKVVDYCEANPKASELIPRELPICQQMAELLPLKIAKMQQEDL